MATTFNYDPAPVGMKRSAMAEPQRTERFGEATLAPEQIAMPREGRAEANKRYPGYVRLAILLGGALACWAVIGGVVAVVL